MISTGKRPVAAIGGAQLEIDSDEADALSRAGDRSPDGGAPEIPPDDAQANFETVVRNFLTPRTKAGLWTYAEKGRHRRLKLSVVSDEKLKRASRNLYDGNVTFTDEKGAKVVLRFTVDYGGDVWEVVSVGAPRAAAKPAPLTTLPP